MKGCLVTGNETQYGLPISVDENADDIMYDDKGELLEDIEENHEGIDDGLDDLANNMEDCIDDGQDDDQEGYDLQNQEAGDIVGEEYLEHEEDPDEEYVEAGDVIGEEYMDDDGQNAEYYDEEQEDDDEVYDEEEFHYAPYEEPVAKKPRKEMEEEEEEKRRRWFWKAVTRKRSSIRTSVVIIWCNSSRIGGHSRLNKHNSITQQLSLDSHTIYSSNNSNSNSSSCMQRCCMVGLVCNLSTASFRLNREKGGGERRPLYVSRMVECSSVHSQTFRQQSRPSPSLRSRK